MPESKKPRSKQRKQSKQPKPKPRAIPRPPPPPKAKQERGIHPLVHFSAHHTDGPMPSSHPHGPYVPIQSHLINTAIHTNGYDYFYFLTWTPCTTLLAMVAGRPGVDDPYSGGSYSGIQLGQNDASSPLSIKPLRLSLKLTNHTSMLTKAGMLFACPFTSPLPINWVADNVGTPYIQLSAANINNLKGVVMNARTTLSIPAMQYDKHNFICPPSNEIAFEQFLDFFPNAVGTNDENLSYQNAYNSVQSNPAMVSWVLYFPATSSSQEVSFSVRRTDACKYPVSTALMSTALSPPTVPQHIQTSVIRGAQAAALAGHTESSLLSSLGSTLEGQAARFGNGLIRGAGHLLEMGASSLFGRLAGRLAPRALALL